MWQHYKKTLWVVQLTIVVVCTVMYFVLKMAVPELLFFVAAMELFGVLGAAWAARLKRKFARRSGRLPLHGKL